MGLWDWLGSKTVDNSELAKKLMAMPQIVEAFKWHAQWPFSAPELTAEGLIDLRGRNVGSTLESIFRGVMSTSRRNGGSWGPPYEGHGHHVAFGKYSYPERVDEGPVWAYHQVSFEASTAGEAFGPALLCLLAGPDPPKCFEWMLTEREIAWVDRKRGQLSRSDFLRSVLRTAGAPDVSDEVK